MLMASVRVLLADDNDEVLGEIREELGEEFEIIGTVSNGQDAIDAVLRFNPDVAVLDLAMPIMDGIQAALCIRESKTSTKILFLTIQESEEYVSAAFAVGASGYVTKRRLLSDLAHAIREVAEGRTFLSPTLRR
jgi:DNA-binding NarL/FixJ family response regulator